MSNSRTQLELEEDIARLQHLLTLRTTQSGQETVTRADEDVDAPHLRPVPSTFGHRQAPRPSIMQSPYAGHGLTGVFGSPPTRMDHQPGTPPQQYGTGGYSTLRSPEELTRSFSSVHPTPSQHREPDPTVAVTRQALPTQAPITTRYESARLQSQSHGISGGHSVSSADFPASLVTAHQPRIQGMGHALGLQTTNVNRARMASSSRSVRRASAVREPGTARNTSAGTRAMSLSRQGRSGVDSCIVAGANGQGVLSATIKVYPPLIPVSDESQLL